MKCYIMSNPVIREYWKWLITKLKENGWFETSEQTLADQAKVNGWLLELEIEERKREAMVDIEVEEALELSESGVIGEHQTNADNTTYLTDLTTQLKMWRQVYRRRNKGQTLSMGFLMKKRALTWELQK